jgi:hypothetical protein
VLGRGLGFGVGDLFLKCWVGWPRSTLMSSTPLCTKVALEECLKDHVLSWYTTFTVALCRIC